EAARGRALAPVEDGPGDVGRLVREREAEEDEHHDGLDQHDADERLVVAHDLGLLPGDGRDVGPEPPAHARVSSERSARTVSTSSAKTAPSGRILPRKISSEVAGVTWSCSKVPASRSLTMDTAVMSVVRKESTKPKVPETMNRVPSSVGLKSARVTTSTPP